MLLSICTGICVEKYPFSNWNRKIGVVSWAGFKSNTDQIEAIIIHPLLEDLQLYVIGHTRARTGKIRLHFLFVLKFRINSLALFEYPCSILHAHRITIGDWIFTS